LSDLISIIMPAYNVASYIQEAIDSVLEQSHKNWELLVIDNGSTDETQSLIKNYSDPRIRTFDFSQNKGVSYARNVGLKNMQGSYFCFLDSDDVLTPSSLQSRLTVFQNDPKVAIVDGAVEVANQDLSKTIRVYRPTFKGQPLREYFQLSASCFFGVSCMIKRLPAVSYTFDTEMTHAEDLWFYIQYAGKSQYSYSQEVIMRVRQRKGSAMTNLSGLENGYQELYQRIAGLPEATALDKTLLKKKITRIMALSYLNNRQPVAAMLSIFRNLWQ